MIYQSKLFLYLVDKISESGDIWAAFEEKVWV